MSGLQDAQALHAAYAAFNGFSLPLMNCDRAPFEHWKPHFLAAVAALTQSAPPAAPQDAESRQAPVRVLSDGQIDAIWDTVAWEFHTAKDMRRGYARAVEKFLASIHPSAESEGSEKT